MVWLQEWNPLQYKDLRLIGFTSCSRIFHLYGDVAIAGEGLQNLGLCSALRAFEQGGIFIVPHLLWHGASVFPVSSEQSTLTTHKDLWLQEIWLWLLDVRHCENVLVSAQRSSTLKVCKGKLSCFHFEIDQKTQLMGNFGIWNHFTRNLLYSLDSHSFYKTYSRLWKRRF
jgi:hypothetical protein